MSIPSDRVTTVQVVLSALRLGNVAAGDESSLHMLALQGLVPAVGRCTDRCAFLQFRIWLLRQLK